jgi:hypothetical protein
MPSAEDTLRLLEQLQQSSSSDTATAMNTDASATDHMPFSLFSRGLSGECVDMVPSAAALGNVELAPYVSDLPFGALPLDMSDPLHDIEERWMRPRPTFDDALLPKVQRLIARGTDYTCLIRPAVSHRRTTFRVKRCLVTGDALVNEYDEVWTGNYTYKVAL